VVRWYVFDDVFGETALQVRDDHTPHAPEFLLVETANALNQYVRRKLVSVDESCRAVALTDRGFVLTPDRDLLEDAQRLAAEIEHGVYDCLYAVLARRLEIPLITADFKFADKLSVRSDIMIRPLQGA